MHPYIYSDEIHVEMKICLTLCQHESYRVKTALNYITKHNVLLSLLLFVFIFYVSVFYCLFSDYLFVVVVVFVVVLGGCVFAFVCLLFY